MAPSVRILGIDCGSQVTGYGVIEAEGRTRQAVAYGAIRVPRGRELPERLRIVADGLEEVLDRFQPAEAAVEDVFQGGNARSAVVLAHVRGAALVCLARAGLPVASYAPKQVKSSVVGHGSADKRQVQQMVQVLLGLGEAVDSLDASDALAVAYCHANRRNADIRGG